MFVFIYVFGGMFRGLSLRIGTILLPNIIKDVKTTGDLFIVDDDADDRGFVLEALADNGFDIRSEGFENGAALLEHLTEHPSKLPKLILLDLNMPIKDGFETLKELRSDPDLRSIPVVVLTSSSRDSDETDCKDLGCSQFIRKPMNYEEYVDLSKVISDYF
jgi:CheY-like chemotaxis protein